MGVLCTITKSKTCKVLTQIRTMNYKMNSAMLRGRLEQFAMNAFDQTLKGIRTETKNRKMIDRHHPSM